MTSDVSYSSTAEEHMTNNPKFKSLNPAIGGTRRRKKIKTGFDKK